jgi:hypothetical protein
MKHIESQVVCDLCKSTPAEAQIRCEKHEVDLCTRHLRAHFDRKECFLIPIEREPTELGRLLDKFERAKGEKEKN